MSQISLHHGDCLEILPTLDAKKISAIITDPPYGMRWDTDSTRFSGGQSPTRITRGCGRSDWVAITGDDRNFDPSPWLVFPNVVLWGANHYAARLPVGTMLVWIKKADHLFGTFLSDAEIGWMKGGHGIYCYRQNFPPPCRIAEGGLKNRAAHPTQKPVGLMKWCIGRLKLAPGATILDPYLGSGGTGVAAVNLGYNFIGIESHEPYFRIAERRIKAEVDKTALFADQTACDTAPTGDGPRLASEML